MCVFCYASSTDQHKTLIFITWMLNWIYESSLFLLLVPRVRWGLLTGRGEETSGSPNGDGDDDDEKIEGGLSW